MHHDTGPRDGDPSLHAPPDPEVVRLAALLRETAEHHDPYERSAPAHDWWDWYAAYLQARLLGGPPEEASAAAGAHVDGVLRGRT